MRTIDADKLKEVLERNFRHTGGALVLTQLIDAQDTVHPEPHWIPVTEEPTERTICYVTLKDTNDENRQNWVAEMIYTPWDGFDLMDGIEAIAWMPKQYPEPYKGVTE